MMQDNVVSAGGNILQQKLEKHGFLYHLNKHKLLYLIGIPGFLWVFIFCYVPMAGIVVAFQDYNPIKGIFESNFVGGKHFTNFFNSYFFGRLITNTLLISFLKLLIMTPAPIIFAILLNEVINERLKKVVQTVTYLPHFISWIVIVGFLENLLSPSTGAINKLLVLLEKDAVFFMGEPQYFIPIVLCSTFWQGFGWSSIIYLAAISNISVELYEAATIDGCNRFQKIWHITLTGIRPLMTMIIMISVANILNSDFGQLVAIIGSNAALYEIGDVIDTYVYRVGILTGQYSFGTAIGLFKGAISTFLIATLNWFAKKMGEEGLF